MPYSLLDIFGGKDYIVDLFAGGQLYQDFLSATRYHRWKSPIDGELVASWVEPGTYFAQRPGQGDNLGTLEGTESQPYLGRVATRAIFLFKNPSFGYVAMICIGMVEVSTCHIEPEYSHPLDTVLLSSSFRPTIPIKKEAAIGNFEFGGSSHMLL